MYRIFLLIVDLATLIFLIIMTIVDTPRGGEVFALLLVYSLIILNIMYILFSKTDKETWLTLYFKRKALEEKKKIKTLQDE